MSVSILEKPFNRKHISYLAENAGQVSNLLKVISHEGRLLILCHLSSGEKSVTRLEELLDTRQAAVSQQLSRLRLEGLVKYRREGKTVYYRLANERAQQILNMLYDLSRITVS